MYEEFCVIRHKEAYFYQHQQDSPFLLLIMAPSAVETSTTEANAKSYKFHLSPYKEVDIVKVNRDVEEGRTNEPAAKVSLSLVAFPSSSIANVNST